MTVTSRRDPPAVLAQRAARPGRPGRPPSSTGVTVASSTVVTPLLLPRVGALRAPPTRSARPRRPGRSRPHLPDRGAPERNSSRIRWPPPCDTARDTRGHRLPAHGSGSLRTPLPRPTTCRGPSATCGRRAGSRSRSPRSSAATPRPRIAAGEPLIDGRPRLRGDGHPPARERPPGRARHHPARRAGPGQDPADPGPGRAARRVAAGGRRARRSTTTPTTRPRASPGVRVAEEGDETPIDWVHRSDRYGEKLATPDTSIADLIGEVDPIKVAEGRYLSDELALHYGLVPRVNRGIFAINELPDLAERIQVGLLNVLEERDVQIRGHRIRLPARRRAGGHGQPRGLHQPGSDHHPAEGPLRRPDPHPLPAGHRAPRWQIMRAEAELPEGGPAGDRARRTWRRWWPRSASWPGAARTSTSAAACRSGSPSPTTRRWWPTPCAGRCGPASRWPCPG